MHAPPPRWLVINLACSSVVGLAIELELLTMLCVLCRSPSYKWLEKACTVTKPAGSPDRWLVTLTEVWPAALKAERH